VSNVSKNVENVLQNLFVFSEVLNYLISVQHF